MITEDELNKLDIGNTIWKFSIGFGIGGGISYKIISQMEKIGDGKFKIIKVESASSRYFSDKLGEITNIPKLRFYQEQLFRTREEGVEYWNSRVYEEIDHQTMRYEKKIKSLKRILIT